MFNKRHYEAIALVIQSVPNDLDGHAYNRAEYAKRFADMFARDNSRFLRERFLAACQPNANVKLRTRYTPAGARVVGGDN